MTGDGTRNDGHGDERAEPRQEAKDGRQDGPHEDRKDGRQDDLAWRDRLAAQLLGGSRAKETFSFSPAGSTALEIALGKARSELTYLLEFGRAHHLPIVGNVMGDEVWIRLGDTTLKFTLDRAAVTMTALVVGQPPVVMSWDDAGQRIARETGDVIDVDAFVRSAVDATVTAWRRTSSPPPAALVTEKVTVTLPDPREYEVARPDRQNPEQEPKE
jgi:hypothetical protein